MQRRTEEAGTLVVPPASEYELALRRAAKAGLVAYEPGASSFTVPAPSKLTAAQLAGLRKIEAFLAAHKTTGVQPCVEDAVRKLLNLVVVYPAEDETPVHEQKGD